jgi:hypothetical protein
MGQTTLLPASAGKDPRSFVVSVERTIRLAEFESLRLALSESFPSSVDKDEAYRSVLGKVQEWSAAAKPTTQQNSRETPRADTSKPALTIDALRERLAGWLQDLEITDGFDGFTVKPRRYLGQTWQSVNDTVRSLGGHWQTGHNPRDGCWRIKK